MKSMQTDYVSFKAPRMRGVILKKGSDCVFDPVSLLHIPDDPAFCCKKGRSVQAGADGKWFVKRFRPRNLLKRILYLFKPSRSRKCLKSAILLAAAGVDTPEVAAVLQMFRGFWLEMDYLITEDISGRTVFCDKIPLSKDLAEQLVCFLVKLHDAGIEHGDLNLRNIYLSTDGKLGVIDLDSCRFYRRAVSEKRRRRELARLASSFIKLAVAKKNTNDLPENISEYFAGLYCRCSGMDLDSACYRKRVRFLVERKRK